VQSLSLMLAIIANSLCFKSVWPVSLAPIIGVAALVFAGIGYLFFLYAITSMLAATMSLFRVVTWYQMYSSTRSKSDDS
jgi:membrane protein implicated in regulation of membrane protease activity